MGARSSLDHLGPLERAHAVAENRARDPWETALELVEAARATEHLAHDEERPAGRRGSQWPWPPASTARNRASRHHANSGFAIGLPWGPGWFGVRTSRSGPTGGTVIEHSQEDKMTAIHTSHSPPLFDELGGSFRGELLLTSPGYDAARRIWNGAKDRRPACIARCAGVADVRGHGALRARPPLGDRRAGRGATTWRAPRCATTGSSSTSRGCGPFVDPTGRTAWVQAGALWGTSTTRRRPTVWRPPAASSATPASPGSPSAAASAS